MDGETAMNKKMILVFLAGWAFAMVFPPQRLRDMARNRG